MYQVLKNKDNFYQWIANKLVPNRLVYWITIKGIALSTQNTNIHPGELSCMGLLDCLDEATDKSPK